jgi:5'-3' exonuclease
MKLRKLLMSVLIVMLVCTPALAQKAKADPVDKATAKARCEIIAKELQEMEARMYAARKKIEKTEAIQDLRKEAAEAEDAYQKGKTADPAVVAAKEESRAADREYDALLLKKVKTSSAGMALLKEQVALDNKRAACSLRVAIAEIRLTHEDSPIVRALAADPILAQFYRAYSVADGDARVEAKADYEKLRKATLEDMPAARALMTEIKTAKTDEDAAEKALDVVDDKLDALRDKVKKSDDSDLVAARARYSAAQAAYQKAYYGGKMQALRDNREKTRAAIYAGVKKAIADDPILAALSSRIHQLGVQYKKLGGRKRRSSSRR